MNVKCMRCDRHAEIAAEGKVKWLCPECVKITFTADEAVVLMWAEFTDELKDAFRNMLKVAALSEKKIFTAITGGTFEVIRADSVEEAVQICCCKPEKCKEVSLQGPSEIVASFS